MSRSYRKPWYVDGYGTKRKRCFKRYANKRIRKSCGVPNGKAYVKFYDSYLICDYKFLWNPRPRCVWISGVKTWYGPSDPMWKVCGK
jgi:hypothetical protein